MTIKLRVGGSYWENKANQILNDVEIKTLTMPLSFSPKRNIVFVCCNCRAEFSIDSDIKDFNCPYCDAIFKKNEDGTYTPKNQETIDSMVLVKHTLELIQKLKPKFWIIENPRAMLRKQTFMPNDKRKTVTYCQYGLEYQKATDLWNNIDTWIPKPMCSPKSPCHVRAPRGSRYGIQQGVSGFRANRPNQKHPDISMLKTYGKTRESLHPKDLYATMEFNWDGSARVLRGVIPPKLCEEILNAIEGMFVKDGQGVKQ